MTRLTIGIPTYNRAGLLERAIRCAIAQTTPGVEILVSDNASTDATGEVARSFGDRVRYHRNERNLGAWGNFARIAELATGDAVAWLQDDDFLHREFAGRAIDAFRQSADVAAYLCYAIHSPSPATMHYPILGGPAVPLPWLSGERQWVDGLLVPGHSFFYSVGNPPAMAIRTDLAREALKACREDCTLYNERIVLSAATAGRRLAIDPWPGAIFSRHGDQDHTRIMHEDPRARLDQWAILARWLGDWIERAGGPWEEALVASFREIAPEHRLLRLNDLGPEPSWRAAHPIAARIRRLMIETLPDDARARLRDVEDARPALPRAAKAAVRGLTPPVVWHALRGVRRALRGG